MASYILHTHLLEAPKVSFYYKGTSLKHDVPYALNSVVCFEKSEALRIHDKQKAISLCYKLNKDKQALFEAGYATFEINRY